MKVIAFYLPQFHEIEENNKWWGKGFTEWTNTKKSIQLFKGHYQPREPLNDFYYNLLDPKTREWQAELAKKYGIYGFCYYHYWFKGKKLLEKPAEEILKLKSPKLPFCFSWANEPWTRAWDGREKEVLMPQDYGDKNDWVEHFNYLLPFFKDERYIKIDNKPMFLIYRSASIPCCDEMIELWNDFAVKNGFNGIYFIKTLNSFEIDTKNKNFNAQVEFEPMFTLVHDYGVSKKIIRKMKSLLRNSINFKNYLFLNIEDYDYVWQRIIKRKRNYQLTTYLGAFVDWDNSPRKGTKATIFKGSNPEKFKNYFKEQVKKSKQNGTEFLFINAWNEWAEGTYLEPDKKYGFAYLEAIKEVLLEHEQNK
ncbi:glycosyltransferase WbsX family protein [Caproiciproducens sp. MSJ-32]|uniref:glycosyltransferase WbsX family protein n=1 Tax=Caproiciproducens sp. MSJ-32 TaxID=2841527 RepID=UPI001C1241F5|nr:glycoside hydrolase family 99-like domain-containing protein [Caproiciproducens sp. MSJ-32]MBU5455562.1 glycoside hydrolase family 99-like domain-containing protein [Caproiciproducens sp. MSJ-32]